MSKQRGNRTCLRACILPAEEPGNVTSEEVPDYWATLLVSGKLNEAVGSVIYKRDLGVFEGTRA